MRSLVLLIALTLVGCTPSGGLSTVVPVPPSDVPQVLRVVTGFVPSSLTPAAGTAGHFMAWTIYDSVTQFGPNFQVRPSVAERWVLSSDGATWTLSLRRDMRWPDGSPLTATDVVFSLEQTRQRRWPQTALFASIASVQAADPATVVLTMRFPDISLPNNLPYLWVLPQAAIAASGLDAFSERPFGSGPYEVAELRPGVSLTVRKRVAPAGVNLHPFRKPIADEIQFTAVVDPSQKIAGLRSGEVDIAAVHTFTSSQVDQLLAAEMTVKTFPLATLAIAYPDGAMTARASPLRDKRVRLALNYAVDKVAIASLFHGSEPVGQYASPGSLYWDPAASPFPYDPARAKQLLAEAGYPSGLRIESGLEYQPNIMPTDIALSVQRYLADVGVEAPLVPLEANAYLDKAYGRNGQLKAELFGAATLDSNGFATNMRTFLGCSSPSGGGATGRWYCNRDWDRLITAATTERDPARRETLMREANRLQREDVPFLYLIVLPGYTVLAPTVRGADYYYLRIFSLDSTYRVR
ncbi:MAG: ABC transporter substrate-binding protein [Dehalococcoidia bacterium]|nr:MAG: ABC transporter substrate-binding protein [Dehalococcoidia bacterium]